MLWALSAWSKLQRDVKSGETRGRELEVFDDFVFPRLARLASAIVSREETLPA
jgi:hypothetical protein